MYTIRTITHWVKEYVQRSAAIIAITCTLLVASAANAFAAPGDWVTPNCSASGLDTFKSGLEGLTQSIYGWAIIAFMGVAVLCIIAIPVTAVFSKNALSAVMKILFWIALVLFFAGAILTFIFAKATCVL